MMVLAVVIALAAWLMGAARGSRDGGAKSAAKQPIEIA
jgi:hypothetical protein